MFSAKKYKDDPFEAMEEGGAFGFLANDDYKDSFDEFEGGSSFNGFVGAFADPYLSSFNASENIWDKAQTEEEYFHKKEKQSVDAYSQRPAPSCTSSPILNVSSSLISLLPLPLPQFSSSPKPESAIRRDGLLSGNFDSDNEIALFVEEQPAVEVRTRTPSENRTFTVTVRIKGAHWEEQYTSARVSLTYASPDPEGLTPNQTILGGTKTVRLDHEGRAQFESLCMSEASTKHKEREFRLAFSLVRTDGRVTEPRAVSNPFYAYTHKKVLCRRRNIKLRTLNCTVGSFAGGEQMHVIGAPFIAGPSLKCIMKTPHGDAVSPHIELFSESVLFFTLPPYPLASWSSTVPEGTEVKVQFVVSNDGKTLSNPLDFTYVASGHRSRY